MTGTSRRLTSVSDTRSSESSAEGGQVEDRQFANTLARGLAVLRCFSPEDQLLGNKELSARTGLSRPTITRLTYTLTRLGYLAYFPKLGRYRLAPGILSLGYPLLAGLTIRQIARPFMEQLASHSRGNVSLAMRAGLEMIYADTVRSTTGMLQPPDIGLRYPIHNGASGRAYLAACPDLEREAILKQMRAACSAEAWSEQYREIEIEIERYKQHGFCISTTARPGIHAVGVPMKGVNPEMIIVNCGVPIFELKGDALYDDIAPRLMSVARNIEMAVGANQFRSSPNGGR